LETGKIRPKNRAIEARRIAATISDFQKRTLSLALTRPASLRVIFPIKPAKMPAGGPHS
jgi:hypothetical protein